ncbi:MAG TPA: hypothetical protein VNA25_04945 [Phycisphaerae bacterium]|nr:hypothetical protein [Phycisphaerae bacterium]
MSQFSRKSLTIVGRTTVTSSSANEAMLQKLADTYVEGEDVLDMGTRHGRHDASLRALAKIVAKRKGL